MTMTNSPGNKQRQQYCFDAGGAQVKAASLRMTEQELRRKVYELTLQLAVANENLSIEAAKCEQLGKALEESTAIIRKMEEQNQQAMQMEELGKIMAPALAHELGNILATISSQSQFCIEKITLRPPLDEAVGLIYEVSQKGNDLLKRFLEAVRLAKFKGLSHKPLNVNNRIRSAWKTAKVRSGDRKISFLGRLDEKLPQIKGNAEDLERVFHNLFLNAIQAFSGEGEVIAETEFSPSEKMVEISVIDNGPGIPKADRGRLFEPFFTTKEEGTGLGLSICRSIIQQHRGSIAIESNRIRGTKVVVRMPTV